MKAKLRNPKTINDINDIREQITTFNCVAFATVLRDKFGFSVEDTKRAINEVNYLTDSQIKDYVTYEDLAKELKKDGFGCILNASL